MHFELTPITGYLLILLLAEAAGSSVVVWDSTQLAARCIMGSVIGSMAIVAFLGINKSPDGNENRTIRKMACEFLVSVATGITATPMAIRWLGWNVDSDVVVYVSAVLSFIATSLLRVAFPIAQSLIVSAFNVIAEKHKKQIERNEIP